jgi:hypothetical protein
MRNRQENSDWSVRADRGQMPLDLEGRLAIDTHPREPVFAWRPALERSEDGRWYVYEQWGVPGLNEAGADAQTFDPAKCLRDFIALHDAGDNAHGKVLAFAERYGVLDFCQHDDAGWRVTNWCPECHELRDQRELDMDEWGALGLKAIRALKMPFPAPVMHRCPVNVFIGAACHMRAILGIQADLRAGEPTREEDWAALGYTLDFQQEFEKNTPETFRDLRSSQAGWLGTAIHDWLRLPDAVRLWPEVSRSPDAEDFATVHVGLGPHRTLRAILVAQMLAVLNSRRGIFRCSFCDQPYGIEAGNRRPWRNGKRGNYCPSCRTSLEVHAAKQSERYWDGRARQRSSKTGEVERATPNLDGQVDGH